MESDPDATVESELADSAPSESTRTESVPTSESMPTQSTPTESIPTESARRKSTKNRGKKRPPATKRRREISSRQMLTAAAIVVIVSALAAGAWFYWAGNTKFKDEETTLAKTNVCSAYTVVRDAVAANSNFKIAKGDVAALYGARANIRLALLGSGLYLHDRVAQEPAAPADLVKAANSLAKTIDELGINDLANRDNVAQAPLREDLNSEIVQLNSLCK